MSNRNTDILQVRKYLKGELDTHAMHELERRALDDPFLMDALEGLEKAGPDQQANLDELGNRLQLRVEKKERRIIPWMQLSIAASVLIVLGAGLWLYTNKQQSVIKESRVAAVVKPEEKSNPDTAPIVKEDKKQVAQSQSNAIAAAPKKAYKTLTPIYDSNPPQVLAPSTAGYYAKNDEPAANADYKAMVKPYKDSVPLNEVVVTNFKAKKIDTSLFVRKPVSATKDQLLQGKVEGLTITPSHPDNYIQPKTINGIVIGKDDGRPITGAVVKVAGSTRGVITDVNGRFALPNVADKQTVTVGYLGYNSKQVQINKTDSLNIALDPNNSSLAEVAVVRKAPVNNENDDVAVEDAKPKDGWKTFDAYLAKNAVSTDGMKGKVRVSFMVDRRGNLSNFKIIKSLSNAADQKAIDLIQNGPAWMGASDKQSHEIKVTVKFH